MASHIEPASLTDGFYRLSMNTLNRGGVLQCRPGYEWKFNPPVGNFQGGALFRPFRGINEQIVFAVDGIVYVSNFPFTEIAIIPGISFDPNATTVYFETAEKSVELNSDGSTRLVAPYKVLIMQDGTSSPAAWDGVSAVQLTGSGQTPIGTIMKWSGNRLWVARKREVFVSNIYDPFNFTETEYLSDVGAFNVGRDVTAMAEATNDANSPLLVFTDETTVAFKSYITARSTWTSVENFQKTLFPNLGCLAHLSPVTSNGLLWWWSNHGLTNFDAALSAFNTTEFRYQDLEMARSKGYLGSTLEGIATAAFENYLLVSVPYADVYNTHTWVLDSTPMDLKESASPDAWCSYWTGTRPIQWLGGPVQGRQRLYHFSRDLDGKVRFWEAFSSERTDNGCPITWTVETRGYTGGNLTRKEFRYAELFLSELEGTVDLSVHWAGVYRGAFKKCFGKRIEAKQGPLDMTTKYGADDVAYNLKKQTRVVRTVDVKNVPPDPTGCGIESELREGVDIGFQLLIICSGPGALRGVRLFLDQVPEDNSGKCDQESEEGEINAVRSDGFGADDLEDLAAEDSRPVVFTSSAQVSAVYNDEVYVASGSGESRVSQEDADKIALCHATADASEWLTRRYPYLVGNPDNG